MGTSIRCFITPRECNASGIKLCNGYFNKVLYCTQRVLCNASGIKLCDGYFNKVHTLLHTVSALQCEWHKTVRWIFQQGALLHRVYSAMRMALKQCYRYFNKVLCYTQSVLCNAHGTETVLSVLQQGALLHTAWSVLCNASGINVRGYFNQVLYYTRSVLCKCFLSSWLFYGSLVIRKWW